MFRTAAALMACLVLGGCTPLHHLAVDQSVGLPPCIPEDIATLPAGARVELHTASGGIGQSSSTWGTVLKASTEGVALVNCDVQCRSQQGHPILSKSPVVGRLFKNSGVGREQVPVLWVPRQKILATCVITPPPTDYVAPALDIDTSRGSVFKRVGVDFDFAEP